MIVFINAYEHIYNSLHGMSTCGVFNCDSIEEVEEIAVSLSRDVIESYSCIIDSFENPDNEDEIIEDIAFTAYKVKDSILEKLTIVDLDNAAAEIDKEEFVELYCDIIPLSVC